MGYVFHNLNRLPQLDQTRQSTFELHWQNTAFLSTFRRMRASMTFSPNSTKTRQTIISILVFEYFSYKFSIYCVTDGPNDCRRHNGNLVLYFRRFTGCHGRLSPNHCSDALDGNATGLAVNNRRHWNAWLWWVTFQIHFKSKLEILIFSTFCFCVFFLLGLSVVTYYCFARFKFLKEHPPTEATVVTNFSKLLEKWGKEKDTWLYSGIITAVILVIILLIVLVLRERIVIAIALVKEGSKYGIFSLAH